VLINKIFYIHHLAGDLEILRVSAGG